MQNWLTSHRCININIILKKIENTYKDRWRVAVAVVLPEFHFPEENLRASFRHFATICINFWKFSKFEAWNPRNSKLWRIGWNASEREWDLQSRKTMLSPLCERTKNWEIIAVKARSFFFLYGIVKFDRAQSPLRLCVSAWKAVGPLRVPSRNGNQRLAPRLSILRHVLKVTSQSRDSEFYFCIGFVIYKTMKTS